MAQRTHIGTPNYQLFESPVYQCPAAKYIGKPNETRLVTSQTRQVQPGHEQYQYQSTPIYHCPLAKYVK